MGAGSPSCCVSEGRDDGKHVPRSALKSSLRDGGTPQTRLEAEGESEVGDVRLVGKQRLSLGRSVHFHAVEQEDAPKKTPAASARRLMRFGALQQDDSPKTPAAAARRSPRFEVPQEESASKKKLDADELRNSKRIRKAIGDVVLWLILVALVVSFPKSSTVVLALWLLMAASTWNAHFANRMKRDHPEAPSYGKRPAVKEREDFFATLSLTFRTFAWLGKLPRDSRRQPATPHCPGMAAGAEGSCPVSGAEVSESTLDMNHVHVSLFDYLLASIFVSIPALSLIIQGLGLLALVWLQWILGLAPRPTDAQLHEMASGFLVNNCAAWFQGMVEADTDTLMKEDDQGGDDDTMCHARFLIRPIQHWVNQGDGSLEAAGRKSTLKVDVDVLSTPRKIMHATLDGEAVTIQDLNLILAMYILSVSHPKVHAYGNWGVDTDRGTKQASYLHWKSVVTVVYNHFGFHNAPGILRWFVDTATGDQFGKNVEDGLKDPIPAHAQVRKLAKYARYPRFIIAMRGSFLRLFKQMRSEYFSAHVDGESYFVGTVIHSLEHEIFNRLLDRQVLFNMTVSPKLASMHRATIFLRFTVTDDIPGIVFSRYYRTSPVEFHKRIYNIAMGIDPDFAKEIQTCIVK